MIWSKIYTSLKAAQFDYTISPKLREDFFHVNVVRGQMTRNIGNGFPHLLDELDKAFDDLLRGENEGTYLYVISETKVPSLNRCTFRLGASSLLFLGSPHYFKAQRTVLCWP
jgi:hypothetical protein